MLLVGLHTECETGGDDGGQTLWDGCDGKGDSDLEVVDGTLDPGASVDGIVKVSDINSPDEDTDDGDYLSQKA